MYLLLIYFKMDALKKKKKRLNWFTVCSPVPVTDPGAKLHTLCRLTRSQYISVCLWQ